MKKICEKTICTGCGLCASVCSRSAIFFSKGESGHLYPIIDQGKCVDCGLCVKKCPSNTPLSLEYPLNAYAAFSKDTEDYRTSTSGAAASVFSSYIINQGGVVYGCAVCNIDRKTIDVKHIRVTTKEQLLRLKGSKYVQSRIVDVLPFIREDINSGRNVLFIGTPCQVAAVRKLFPKKPDNLYTVDLICHGVPSLYLLQKHIKTKIADNDIDDIRFRNGSGLYLLLLLLQGKTLYSSELFKERYKDEYYNAFFDGFSYRASCYKCRYATSTRVSDITIGDFWGLGKEVDASYIEKHDNGISVILPITQKGVELLQSVEKHLNIYERPINEAINGNTQLREPKALNCRIRLFKTLEKILPFKYAYRISVFDKKLRLAVVKLFKAKS